MNQQLEEYLAAYRADWIKAGPPSPHLTIAMVDEIERLRGLLQKHGRHSLECSRPLRPDCDCGWDEVKASLPSREPVDSR